ncbi:MAG: DUF707 domain-containing protein [Deltaproteobacteria bacterium]|nr:DUF707 domain-containing protein [Deltaproteobacteria bacterium]
MLDKFSNMALVSGIYLSDQENNIEHIVDQFNMSSKWNVRQKWAAIGNLPPSQAVKKVTDLNIENGQPKFVLINKMLGEEVLHNYDFVIICDDDITLPSNFLDTYLDLVLKNDFALAQPARTHNSFIDWHFVEQLEGLKARRTYFVEIGPLLSMRRDIFSALLPFDESSSMGWGYDFVWPHVIEKMGLRMGIVDATPVEHSMRRPVRNYNYEDARKGMEHYLSRNLHLSKSEAFRILESYA